MKTNGARFLESLGIPFELREYEIDPHNPDDLTAIAVARKIGMPAEQVFKTLLTTGAPSDRSSGSTSYSRSSKGMLRDSRKRAPLVFIGWGSPSLDPADEIPSMETPYRWTRRGRRGV